MARGQDAPADGAGPGDAADGDGAESSCEEEEGVEGYRPGGYHRVTIGEAYKNERYLIRKKLGWGHFSTVWLAWDRHENRDVALKIQKSAQHYTEAAMDEIVILKQIAKADPENNKCVVKLLDHFKHSGPNGLHVCLVFELLGHNLLSLIKRHNYQGIPLPMVKQLAFQILVGLDYLHRQLSIIHTDLKPENILLVSPLPEVAPNRQKRSSMHSKRRFKNGKEASSIAEIEAFQDAWNHIGACLEDAERRLSPACETSHLDDISCKIVDLGNACWTYKQFTSDIQTRQYRCPEVLLGAKYSTPADMWSFACVVFELATGDVLFDPHSGHDFDRDEVRLSLNGLLCTSLALLLNSHDSVSDATGSPCSHDGAYGPNAEEDRFGRTVFSRLLQSPRRAEAYKEAQLLAPQAGAGGEVRPPRSGRPGAVELLDADPGFCTGQEANSGSGTPAPVARVAPALLGTLPGRQGAQQPELGGSRGRQEASQRDFFF